MSVSAAQKTALTLTLTPTLTAYLSEDAKFVRSKKITNQFSEQERVPKQALYVSYLRIGPVFLVFDSHATVHGTKGIRPLYVGHIPSESR